MQSKNIKNRGISFLGIIVLVGLVALIAWGLNYIITKDYVVLRPPTTPRPNNSPVADTTSIATSTLATQPPQISVTPTSIKPVATTPTTQPTTPTTSDLIVTFTDKGFSPASLTIKKGQTIQFVNNSSDKMWVAANPFPSSSEYPAFNAKTGAANDSSWSFTFDKTGVWFYHNHYSPAQGGKIVVNSK